MPHAQGGRVWHRNKAMYCREIIESEKGTTRCGGALERRHYSHVEEVGGLRVTDSTGFMLTCTKCGSVTLSYKELRFYALRAAALVLRERTPVPGGVVRHARAALDIKQVELAKLLGVAPESISRWENDRDTMSKSQQLALVAILDGVRSGEISEEELRQPEPVGVDIKEFEVRPTGTDR